MATLAEDLDRQTREADLFEPIDSGRVRCVACGHRCAIPDGARGVCQVRFNRGGRLMAPWGYVSGAHCDPIEKKPFFHAFPGALAFSFGMLGCDLHCSYCQNWFTSQSLRDPGASLGFQPASAQSLVDAAVESGAVALVSTYNEPLITAEWAVEVFRRARTSGLATGFVSNGNGTPEALAYLRPWLDLFKVDLKGFDDRRYRKLGGRLQPVLDSIASLHGMGVWVEVVTLLVPGFNDSDAELRDLARFVAGVSPTIPWHVTAYHEDYRMSGTGNTTPAMLRRAVEIGREAGLSFTYAGNVPGAVGDLESTKCPGCGDLLIERRGYLVRRNRLTSDGTCPTCHAAVPGRWKAPAVR